MAASDSSARRVHLVLFPYPSQSHINPMMELARRLIQRSPDIHVTFINTDYNQERILANGSGGWPSDGASNLRFVLVPDGLPAGHGRLNENVREFMQAVDQKMGGPLEEALRGVMATSAAPVACIVSDAALAWVQGVADRLGLPRVAFWTTAAHANLVYCSQALLQSQGVIPFKGKKDRSELVTGITGVVPLRLSELISFFEDDDDWMFNGSANQFTGSERGKAVMNLGNNIYELEKDAIDAFQRHVRSFLPIGPIFPTSHIIDSSSSSSSTLACHATTSLWPEDRGCGMWLDGQARGSVVYVSFGSIVHMDVEQVREIALGLEASLRPFLWVLRSAVDDPATRSFLDSFQQRTRQRGRVISWAPQLLVLSHPSTATFITHCGWNSLTEAMFAGLPILAFPGGFGEQNMNARYVADIWKIGLEIKRPDGHYVVTHEEISTTIATLMSSPKGDQVKQRAKEVAVLARNAVSKGGSSDQNLDVFIEAVKKLAQEANQSTSS